MLTVDQFGDDNTNKSTISAFANNGTIDVRQHGTGNSNISHVKSGIAPNLAVSSTVTVNQH